LNSGANAEAMEAMKVSKQASKHLSEEHCNKQVAYFNNEAKISNIVSLRVN